MEVYRYDKLYTGANVKILDLLDDEINEKGNTHILENMKLSIKEIKEKYINYFGWWVDLSIDNLKKEYGYFNHVTNYNVEDYIIIADLNEKGLLIITPKPKRKYEVN